MVAPAITLAVAKQHLRVEHTDDDADITRKLEQANAMIWDYIKRSPASGGSTVGAAATFDDGSETIALPDWAKVTFSALVGDAVTIEGGDLRIPAGAATAIEIRATVTHSSNRWAIFGAGWDGAAPVEFGRVQIKSNQPAFLLYRHSVDTTAGGLLAIYLSSDSAAAPMSWTAGEVLLMQEQAAAGAADAWIPTAHQGRILEAATLMQLSKLYDDRNIGEEDAVNVALGYLTPQVTAILHRMRVPALA